MELKKNFRVRIVKRTITDEEMFPESMVGKKVLVFAPKIESAYYETVRDSYLILKTDCEIVNQKLVEKKVPVYGSFSYV